MNICRSSAVVRRPAITRQAALVLAAGVLAGCAGEKKGPPAREIEELPIQWEQSGSHSRLRRSVRVVVRHPATLMRIPLAEVPVDFRKQMVLVAGLGPTTSDSVGIRISRVWREGSRIRVREEQLHPGFDETGHLVRASPWTMVVVPRSDMNVEGYSPDVPRGAFAD